MFNIRKINHIAIYCKNDSIIAPGLQKAVDTSRLRTDKFATRLQNSVNSILSFDSKEEIGRACDKYFGRHKSTLKDFFLEHPTCWGDLQRKIHKNYKIEGNTGKHYLDAEDNIEVSRIFLIRDRKADTGKAIKTAISEGILENSKFIEFCSKQPSLLDSSGFSIAQIGDKAKTYRKLIEQGLIQNIKGCTQQNAQSYFQKVFDKLLRYIPEVYGESNGTYNEIRHCRTPQELGKKLAEIMLKTEHTNYGRRREDAARMLQCFFAWSNIDEIEEMVKIAENAVRVENMKPLLKKEGILLGEIREYDEDGTHFYESSFLKNKQKYTIIWRAKSVKSILQKMAENEDYTNSDSIRDPIGITIIQEPGTSKNTTKELVRDIKQAMPNYGYLVANRNFFESTDIHKLFQPGAGQKMPLDQKLRSGKTTSTNFHNFQLSGFQNYFKESPKSIGTEYQILTREAYDWKKKEDPYYKGKGITELRMRGSKFDTLRGLYRAYSNRIENEKFRKIKEYLNIKNNKPFGAKELILRYIQDGFLIPYIVNGHLTFSSKEKSTLLEKILILGKFYRVLPPEESTDKKSLTLQEVKEVIENYNLE